MAERIKADWLEVNVDTLAPNQRHKYDTYKAQYRAMKAAREDFETTMQAGVPEGERMIFGYNFGKLSVAIVPDDRKPAKSAKAPVSLAQYLATRSASGLTN